VGNQIHLNDTSSILDWITTRDIASAISWIINNDTPIEVDIGTSLGFTNVELLKHLERLLGNSDQWARLAQQTSAGNQVSVVGKDSPLYKSGWIPKDSLDTGLECILN
jgi:nucleoside-diphosphate-sugar epimerase